MGVLLAAALSSARAGRTATAAHTSAAISAPPDHNICIDRRDRTRLLIAPSTARDAPNLRTVLFSLSSLGPVTAPSEKTVDLLIPSSQGRITTISARSRGQFC